MRHSGRLLCRAVGDLVDVGGEADQDTGGVQRVQAQQTDRGGDRAADAVIGGGARGLERAQSGRAPGHPQHDRLVQATGVSGGQFIEPGVGPGGARGAQ